MTAADTLLVMFDVDGTLTESSALDDAAFLDAIRQTFGFHEVSDDWASYRHVTGAGVLQEIVEARLGRVPTNEETGKVQTYLIASLRAGMEATGGVQPVPGAAQIVARLAASPDKYALALASGNWAANVRLMLDSTGVQVDDIPMAFSDDDLTREGICRLAQKRAEERHGRTFSRVVYVGDGVWDVRTAGALGYGFVGIGRDAAAARLRAAGAREVRPDFQDAGAFVAAVGRAAATLPLASPRFAETKVSAR